MSDGLRASGPSALHLAALSVLVATAINGALSAWAGPLAWLPLWLIAVFKCRVVIRSFMGLGTAPLAWQRAFDAWLVAVLAIVALGRWISGG